jgi:hypothetical protein
MSDPSSVILLLEDVQHRQFVYRYLIECRVEAHVIRTQLSPSGKGSAENWVRKQFVKEVCAYRSRKAHAQTQLIVVIDADTHTVRERLRQLNEELKKSGKPPVDVKKEKIARLVPKRNIETWILCLNGETVEELKDYSKTGNDWSARIPQAAKTLTKWTAPNAVPPKTCIDSLRHGVNELRNLRT